MSLNIIEQAKLTRQISGILQRIQKAEGYFSGVPINTVRIADGSITNAKIVDLAVTTGKIANATIQDAQINDLSASKITTGYLSADRIGASSITVTKLATISTLSSITSNIGSVNAGTIDGVEITGPTIRTSSGSSRVQMTGSPERFTVYDSGNKRMEIGEGNIVFYGSNCVRILDGSTLYSQWDASSSSFNIIHTGQGNGKLILREDSNGDMWIIANDEINLIAPTVKLDGSTKTAIVPIDNEYVSLYCAESPDVWFMDFYKDKNDPLFEEVTTGKKFEFKCTNGKTLILSKRKGFESERFTKKTSVEFERNNKLYAA